jgi:ABC-type lipoprotein export system ATPase subunit
MTETASRPGPIAAPIIAVRELLFQYPEGSFELRIPDLVVPRGECVAVVGPSGSGKTTLLHLIAGITTPLRGHVQACGVEVTGLDDAARRAFRIRHVGLVFQEFELLDYLSVLDNVLLPYRINPSLQLTSTVRERAEALAGRVGIADKLGRLSTRLSQGEKQRVAVCRALLAEPELILADEPTGNLDPANKDRVLDILLRYAEERAATLVTVTHDHDLLPRFGRVIDFKTFHSSRSPDSRSPDSRSPEAA